MNFRKIILKISPTFRKIDNAVIPKINNLDIKLESIDNKIKAIEKSIEIFTESNYKKNYYSQDGEDTVLASFYEERGDYKGFYVDIGAFHPLRFSNTHYFYEKGWRGINLDATPGSMKEFEKLRPHDINLEIGITTDGKDLTFYSFKEPALNSFNSKISEEYIQKGWELIEEKQVKTMRINEVLEKYLPKGHSIDFLNIDVEGLDYDILQSLDWSKYSPEYLLIEELEIIDKDVMTYDKNKGYLFLKKLGYAIVAKTRRTLILKKC